MVVLLAAVFLAACGAGTGAARRADRGPPADFSGSRLPAPVPPDRGGEPAPAARPADLPPEPPPPPKKGAGGLPDRGPGVFGRGPAPDYAASLANAARRDEETERLTRNYLAMLSTLAQVSALRAANQTAENYDPIPILRLHAQMAPELGTLAARAGLLQLHWSELAGRLGLPLPPAAGSAGKDREGRIRLLVATCGCIRQDASARFSQGSVWLQARDAGLDDAAIRKREGTPMRYMADMEQLARTVDCSQRALEVLRRD